MKANSSPSKPTVDSHEKGSFAWTDWFRGVFRNLFSGKDKKDGFDSIYEAPTPTDQPRISPELQAQLEAAEKLFGKDFLGPKQFEKAWGFFPDVIPAIPFSPERLASAKKEGMMLRLAVDKTPDGKPMTMKTMKAMQAKSGRNPKLFDNDRCCEDLLEDAPRSGWRLESKSVLKDSTDKDEVEQLELIVHYLKHTVFAKEEIPDQYKDAIAQFEQQKAQITTLMKSEKDCYRASAMIEALDLCKLTRATPVEMIQSIETHHQNDAKGAFLYSPVKNDEKSLLAYFNIYVRIPRCLYNGELVTIGRVSEYGAIVTDYSPYFRWDHVGVALSLQS